MKRVLLMATVVAMLGASCSKSGDDSPKPEETTIEINGFAYPTSKIGNQTWTTVNYKGTGETDSEFGKLYTFTEAKAVSLPSGWRLPTKADYEALLTANGAQLVTLDDNSKLLMGDSNVSQKFMSVSGWLFRQGKNSTEFNAAPNGKDGDDPNYIQSSFWTSSEEGQSSAHYFIIAQMKDGDAVSEESWVDYTTKTDKKAIRFVKAN